MRRALVPIFVLALVLGAARADDEHSLNQHVVSDGTAEGDWCVLEAKVTFDSPHDAQAALPERILIAYIVKSISKDEIEIACETDPPHDAQWETRKIGKGSSSLEDLLHLDAGVKVSSFRTSEEKRPFGAKVLSCTR